MENVLWAAINETIIEEYSRLFPSEIQITIVVLAGILFILAVCVFGLIRIFDASTKWISPAQYSIRFDAKGFSNNELRLYNLKSVNGGCRLNDYSPVGKGHVRILNRFVSSQ